MNWGQRKIRFRLTWRGSSWRIKVPNQNHNGQVRKRETRNGIYRCLVEGLGTVSDRRGNGQVGRLLNG